MTRASFAEAIEKHKDAVYGYALHILGNTEDAEDIVQNVFVSLWQKGGGLDPEGWRPWLLRVCRNACFDVLRRKKVRNWSAAASRVADKRAWGLAAVRGAADDPDLLELEATDAGRGAEHVEASAAASEALAAIRTLNEPARSVIVLRELFDLSYDEIAQTLEISLSSVKVTLHRARKRVRDALGEEMTT